MLSLVKQNSAFSSESDLATAEKHFMGYRRWETSARHSQPAGVGA